MSSEQGAEKRKADAMDCDEQEQAHSPAKKQCTEEDNVEAQFESALDQIRERAQQDRNKLVKAACKHFVDRNGVAPTEEQLIDIFAALSAKFVDGLTDNAEDEEDEEDAEDVEEDGDASELPPNFADALTSSVTTQLNDALDVATSLGKAHRKKLEEKVNALWKQEHNADPTAEETEAVFAVIQATFNGAIIIDGDDDAEDDDYAPTDKDKEDEAKDVEVDNEEVDEEPLKKVNVCIVDDETTVAAVDEDAGDDGEEEAEEKPFVDAKLPEEENDEDYKPTEEEDKDDDDEDMDEDVAEEPKEYNEAEDVDYKPEDDAAEEEAEQEKDEEFAPKVEPAEEEMAETVVA